MSKFKASSLGFLLEILNAFEGFQYLSMQSVSDSFSPKEVKTLGDSHQKKLDGQHVSR